jgi:hypothetical protein
VFSIRLFSSFLLNSLPSLSFLYLLPFCPSLFMLSVLYLCSCFFVVFPCFMYFHSLLLPLFSCVYCSSEIRRNTTNTQEIHRLNRRFVSSVIASHLASGQWLSTFRPTLQWMLGWFYELSKETSVRGRPFGASCVSVPYIPVRSAVSVSSSGDFVWRFVTAVV